MFHRCLHIRTADWTETAVSKAEEAVGKVDGKTKVVGRENDGLLLTVGEVQEKAHQLSLRRIIEKGCGLVENNDWSLLGQGAGDHDLLSLTVGKGLYHTTGKRQYADGGKALANHSKTGVRRTAHGCHLLNC